MAPGRNTSGATRFRFRTVALAGPWRETREQAVDDAVRAGQAFPGPGKRAELVWRLPGEIEEDVVP